jgi:hypothetical protein
MFRALNSRTALAAALAIVFAERLPAQEFQYRIPQAELATRLKKLLEEEKRPAFADFQRVGQPAGGLLIANVRPGTLAEQLGIRPGDIVASINGNASWIKAALVRQSTDTERIYSWAPAGGRIFTETVPAGMIGYDYFSGYFRPEQLFIGKPERHQFAWNEWVTAGLGALIRDPDFAESAWAEAIRLGYPKDDELVDFSSAVISLQRGDLPSTVAARDRFAARFADGKKIPNDYIYALDPLITATHGLDLLESLTNEQGIMAPYSPEMLAKFRAWDAADGLKKHGKSPHERAADMERIDIRAELAPVVWKGFSSDPAKGEFLRTDNFLISREPGSFEIALVGLSNRKLKNLHIRMECWVAEAGRPKSKNNTFDLHLFNLDDPDRQGYRRIAGLLFEKSPGSGSRGTQSISGGVSWWHSENIYRPLTVDATRSIQNESPKTADGLPIEDWYRHPISLRSSPEPTVLEFFRVDGGVQLLIDGRTVVHMPVDPEIANVGYYHRLVGCELKIKTFRAWELKEK